MSPNVMASHVPIETCPPMSWCPMSPFRHVPSCRSVPCPCSGMSPDVVVSHVPGKLSESQEGAMLTPDSRRKSRPAAPGGRATRNAICSELLPGERLVQTVGAFNLFPKSGGSHFPSLLSLAQDIRSFISFPLSDLCRPLCCPRSL